MSPLAPGIHPASALLTTGPFRFSRNSLFGALVATLLGFALLLASWWLVLATLLLACALDRFVIPSEDGLARRGLRA